MGTSASKVAHKVPEIMTVDDEAQQNPENRNGEVSLPTTPILTPKSIRENIEKENLDPRSPSKHIARTPIELLAAAEKLKSITLKSVENEVHAETPLKKHVLLGIDPRSPTLEFQRTPIVVSASPDKKLPEKIRNKNLDKVLKCALPNTPKLLDSSPITPKLKSDAYKRKSFVLLETNIDYTETDLDNVIREKYLGKSLQNLCASEEATYSEIKDPRSPATDFPRTPIQICQEVTDSNNVSIKTIEQHLLENEDRNIDLDESNKSQKEESSVTKDTLLPDDSQPVAIILTNEEDCDVENLSIGQVDNQNFNETELQDKDKLREETELHGKSSQEPLLETCVTETKETIPVTPCKKPLPTRQKLVISPILKKQHLLPKSAPVSPPTIISVTPKKSHSRPVTPPRIDLTADVKELDKKLTHLIYEDEKDLVVCPRVVKVKDQNRTPLGLRNGTENKKKSIQKLKVSDKPRKAEYPVSKIPVFKEKKIKVQCENTPPRSMRPKKPQWDAKDDTLVI